MNARTAKRSDRPVAEAPVSVRASSGNVFEDLGIPNSVDALAKADIAAQIAATIQHRNLTQAQAAAVLRVDQGTVSNLMRGKLRGFSTDRLIRFLNSLGRDVDIVIHGERRAQRTGKLSVLLSAVKRRLAAAK
jgi:predicted XRE-type DNA-binding protein